MARLSILRATALAGAFCLGLGSAAGAHFGTPSATPLATPNLDSVCWQQLADRYAALVAGFDGVVGYELVDLRSGRRLSFHADLEFAIASSIKMPLLLTVLSKLASGSGGELQEPYVPRAEDLVPSSPILSGLTPGVSRLTTRDLLTIMVTTSDNSATNVLISRVGMAEVNQFLLRAGFARTRLRRKMLDAAAVRQGLENVSTPHELALLYEKLWRGELLDPQRTKEALQILSRTKHGYLEAALPDEIEVASKPGSLPGLRTDTGIVLLPSRPFVLSVAVAMPGREREAELLIEKLAQEAYEKLSRLMQSTPFGRKHP